MFSRRPPEEFQTEFRFEKKLQNLLPHLFWMYFNLLNYLLFPSSYKSIFTKVIIHISKWAHVPVHFPFQRVKGMMLGCHWYLAFFMSFSSIHLTPVDDHCLYIVAQLIHWEFTLRDRTKRGEEQGSKSPFSLLSEPISPSPLLFISSSRSIQFNCPYSQLFFFSLLPTFSPYFSLLPTFFGPFLPPPYPGPPPSTKDWEVIKNNLTHVWVKSGKLWGGCLGISLHILLS